ERLDLALAIHDQSDGHRLHPTGRQPALDLVPQERRQAVPDEAVEDAARLLRVHFPEVDAPGLGERRLDCALGDLVERDAVDAFSMQLEFRYFWIVFTFVGDSTTTSDRFATTFSLRVRRPRPNAVPEAAGPIRPARGP